MTAVVFSRREALVLPGRRVVKWFPSTAPNLRPRYVSDLIAQKKIGIQHQTTYSHSSPQTMDNYCIFFKLTNARTICQPNMSLPLFHPATCAYFYPYSEFDEPFTDSTQSDTTGKFPLLTATHFSSSTPLPDIVSCYDRSPADPNPDKSPPPYPLPPSGPA
jgi:hypothetical protein